MDLGAPDALVGDLSPFQFDTVYLNAPFAMCILAAVFEVLDMGAAVVSLCCGSKRRIALLGVGLSLVSCVSCQEIRLSSGDI